MEPIVVWRRPAKRGPGTPLVVFLHGRGADEHDLVDLANALPKAFVYASVRAFVAMPEGGYTWFENRGPARPISSSVRESVRAFRAWLDRPDVAAPGAPVYLLGFSAGMMMAGAVICDDPARFAGAVLLSGALAFDAGLPMDPKRLTGVPVFFAHGSYDDVIPRDLATRTARYLSDESGAELTAKTYDIAHEISHRELADIAAWFVER
jgi:phospholipase/carboxylesterase